MIRLAAALAALAATATVAAVSGPDPQQQAVADGCRRDPGGLYRRTAPNWAYVNDRERAADASPPPQQTLTGVVDAWQPKFEGSHPTPIDNPRSHRSYDFTFDVRPDASSAFLMGTANLSRGDEEDAPAYARMHVERESRWYPQFAWPELGDRVSLRGYWVWDCDHFEGAGERTEIHPIQALWIERRVPSRAPAGGAQGDLFLSTEKTEAGKIADCAHRVKGNTDELAPCVDAERDWTDMSGTYTYRLRLPRRPSPRARLRIRVVDMGSTPNAPSLAITPGATDATVTVVVPRSDARVVVAKRVLASWTRAPRPVHLRVSFRELLVRRAMDPGVPSESTRTGQTSAGRGEWNVYWDVAGVWGSWSPAVLRVRDGQRVRGRQPVDVWVPRRTRFRVAFFARECDFGVLSVNPGGGPMWPCPRSEETGGAGGDDAAGSAFASFRSPAAAVGVHRVNSKLEASTCPPRVRDGCYRVTFVVRRIRG